LVCKIQSGTEFVWFLTGVENFSFSTVSTLVLDSS